MISESLRPSPLPRYRLTPIQWVLLLIGAGILGTLFYLMGISPVAMLLVGMGIAAMCIRRFETTFVLLMGVSMGISFDVLLDFRLTPEGMSIPFNILDFLMLLVFFSACLNLVGRRESLALPRHLSVIYLLFVLATFFGLVYGILVNSGSLNTYFRDFRLFFTLHLCILGVAWFIRTPGQLRLIAYTLLMAAFICACQQNWRLVAMGSQGFSGIRDVTLPTQVLVMAVTFLIIYRHHGIRITPPNTYPFLISFLLLALLVSFTRSIWLEMVISYALSLQYMGGKQKARSIFIAIGIMAILIFVVPFALDLASHGMNLQSLLEERFQQIMGKNDIARQARLVSTADAFSQYMNSPIWGLGVGFPIFTYDVQTQSTAEDTNLHNSLLFYAIKIGAIGLFIMILLVALPLRRMARAASSRSPATTPEQIEIKAFAQSLFAAFLPFSIIGIGSGNLNYNVFMPILGLAIGLHWDRITSHLGRPREVPVSDSPNDPASVVTAGV